MTGKTAFFVLSGAALLLAGCVSPEEQRAQDNATCASFGFVAGTPDFATCLQRESLARRYPPAGPIFWDPVWLPRGGWMW